MRYGMAGSWLLVLPAVERLLLHVPERDFWLVDQQGELNNGRPKEWTWDKVQWATKLVTSSRGVGWNFGHRKVNDARSTMKAQKLDKRKFVLARMPRAILSYVVLDAVIHTAQSTAIPHSWSWEMDDLKQIVFVELLMGLSLYTTMTLQYEVAAMMAVGVAGGQPEVSLMCLFPLIVLNIQGLAATFRKHRGLLHSWQCLGEVLARLYPPGKPINYAVHLPYSTDF
jgi:hypothetical protein